MDKWYTALGQRKNTDDGRFHVYNDDDRVLVGMEMYIWIALAFAFTAESEICRRSLYLMIRVMPSQDIYQQFDPNKVNHYISRLYNRGLITYCYADDKIAAAEKIMNNAIISRYKISVTDRLNVYQSYLMDGYSITQIMRLTKSKLNREEQKVLKRILRFNKTGIAVSKYVLDKNVSETDIVCLIIKAYENRLLTIREVSTGGYIEEIS